jgi:IclR family acetate operon transcriptional repressor
MGDLGGAATVDKAIDVLFHLHASATPCGVTSIGRALGLPKSSTHRLLTALGRRGLVARDERGHYRPGVALIALGLGVLEREPVVEAARPVLEEAASELGETFFLVAAHSGELVVLDKVEGTGFIRAAPQIGSRVPSHATAAGKLYRAFAPELLREGEAAPVGFTPATLTDTDAIASAVVRAREQGWASNRDEWVMGLAVVGAPIRIGARLVAVVAVATATARADELGGDALSTRVLAAARKIESRLESGSEIESPGAGKRAGAGAAQ